MQYAVRIIFSLFTLACSLMLLGQEPRSDGDWGWNIMPFFGLIGLILGTPLAYWIGKKIDNSWHD